MNTNIKNKKKKIMVKNVKVYILKFLCENNKNKWIADVLVLFFGILLQLFFVKHIVIVFGYERCNNLKQLSLMLGMASTIGLSTIIVFGFNLGKSVQQFWQGVIKDHGISSVSKLMMPEININYWQLFILIFLYACIAMDWCTLFYILLIYDVLCYIVLIVKLWLIETIGDKYLNYIYKSREKKGKEEQLKEILQNCIENDGKLNISAVKTYLEWLFIYLMEQQGKEQKEEQEDYFYVEKFYNNFRSIFGSTMESLIIDRITHSHLLLSIIREFCKMEVKNFKEQGKQIMLAAMITYSLDRKKDIDIDLIYKEIINWYDKSIELRYCIAVARLEYLYTMDRGNNRILLSDNIFYLYRSILIENSYENLICSLWYLWSQEDGKLFFSCIESMDYFIYAIKNDLKVKNITEAGDSLYTLVKGLKY